MAINLPDIAPFNFKQFNNGLTISDGMGDTLPLVLDKLNVNIDKIATHLKEKLFSNRSYYVSNTGVSTNTGLSSLSPLSNINDVLQIIYNKLDLNGFIVTINLFDGTYNDFVLLNGIPTGGENNEYPIVIEGNLSNPDLVSWTYNNNINNCCLLLDNQARLLIKNVSFTNSTLTGIDVSAITCKQSKVLIDNVYFNQYGSDSQHIKLLDSVLYYNTVKIRGLNKYFINSEKSIVLSNGVNCTWLFELTASVTALIKLAKASTVILNNITYSGSITGKKYEKDFTSSIIASSYPVGLISTIENDATLDCELTVNNSVNISNNLTVQKDVLLNKNLNVSLNSSIGGNLFVTGSLNLIGSANLGQAFINGSFNTNTNATSTFNGPIKALNSSEFLETIFKEETLFQAKAIFNQDLIALGSVVLPNGVINKANLSASTGTGTVGNNGDVLVSDSTANNGLVWSGRLTTVESNLNLKANLLNPNFDGVPTAPTPARSSNTQQIANTAYVNDLINFTVTQIMTWVQERVPTKMITAWSGNVEDIKAPFKLCITGNSMVKLANGQSMRIDEIVNNKLDIEVLTFNEVTGKIEPKRVVDWYSNPIDDKSNWVNIKTYKTCQPNNVKTLTLTKNHPVWIKDKGWVEAVNLIEGDIVLKYNSTFSNIAKQALAGIYLGDGCFDKNTKTLRLAHGDKQRSYLIDTAIKYNVNYSSHTPNQGYGKGFVQHNACVSIQHRGEDIFELFNQPEISLDLIKYLTPVGLAYWYMDDGNLQTDRRTKVTCAQLHTEGYSEVELQVIKEGLLNYYGLEVNQYTRNNTKGKLTRFSLESSDKFLSMVAPYIHPELRYKLPEKYRNVSYVIPDYTFIEESLSEEKLISITQTNCGRHAIYNTRYDIKVEDNHSFIANGFVIHNCDGTDGTPDLRNKFIMGAGKQTGTAFCINETGGSATATFNTATLTTNDIAVDVNIESANVALTKDQIPNHSHFNNLTMVYYGGNTLPLITGAGGGKGGSSGTTIGFLTPVNESSVGLSQPHSHRIFGKTSPHTHTVNLPANTVNILPPYYVLAYIELKPTTYNFVIS